ncbi:MAG: glycosyltransferase [Pseudomonadota bacterium]
MKVLLVVTSLMGTGHLVRTLLIARALRDAGAVPVVVSGGREIAHLDTGGIEVAQLPPVWSDGIDYSRMLCPAGEVDDAYLKTRADRLIVLFDKMAPDVLVTELWPFGRRSLSGEFATLLDHAKGRARIYASIRDVLEPKKKPKRAEETLDRLRHYYDGVLVHGDPKVIGLGATWPKAAEIADLIHYTGYVAATPPPPDEDSRGEVLVSVGGGVIGRGLLEAAIEAASRQSTTRIWRLRVGGADVAVEVLRLTALAGDAPVIVEPAAADYRARLGACACSVSLLGYNTATDLLTAGRPALIAPMREGGEQEQLIRANAFARLPGIWQLGGLDADQLGAAVDAACEAPGPPQGLVDMNGAAASARVLMQGI